MLPEEGMVGWLKPALAYGESLTKANLERHNIAQGELLPFMLSVLSGSLSLQSMYLPLRN